nr:hypothetical protein [Candidatus Sigynarchaeota archaeon]
MWCPICAGKISTSTSPGIISSTFAIIMHAKKWTELKNILYQQQITRQHIDPVEINHLMVNDVKIAMDIILGKDTPYLACTTETEFSTFEDLVSFQEKSMLPLQKDETAHSAFFVEINTKIRHLASILREVQGRDLTPVIASLLSAPFGKEAYDTIFMWTADALGSSDRHGITIGDAFIAHEADLDKMINFARKLHLSENFEGKSAMSWLVGKEMRALLQYVTGKQDHLPIIASKCQIKEFQASLQLQETPDFLPFKEGFMIRRAFYQEALARRDQAKKLLAEVDGCDVSNVIAGVYHKQFPELGLRVMQIYMQELQVPFTYDDFDLVSTPEYSWFLGALLAEGTITKHNVNYNSVRLRINETNPAIFFDHAIPLVRHPSFTGQELTLSPALTRFLFPDMKRGEQVSKHLIPFDHVNRDMFLAGFFDCHGCVSRPRSICLHLPYKTPEAWLDIMPFTMPATLTGDIFDQSTPYTHYNPSERNTFRVHICGRRVPEDSGLPDEERASIVADNIRYWFKKIFPHCVHPRLELIHQVGEYMDMRFGKAKNASTYTNILRNLLDTSHRIDLSGIEDTLSRPLRDPRTGNTILYIPKWLDQFNKRHGFSMGDMLASCDRSGGFVPFPCMQQDMESSLDTDEADW